MQYESGSNPYECNFGRRREEETEVTERRAELVGSKTKIEASRTRTKGRMGAEEERTRRESK